MRSRSPFNSSDLGDGEVVIEVDVEHGDAVLLALFRPKTFGGLVFVYDTIVLEILLHVGLDEHLVEHQPAETR